MITESENLIDTIYKKLKKINSRKLNLTKHELEQFILFLINNN